MTAAEFRIGLFRAPDGRPGGITSGRERKTEKRLVEVSPQDITLEITDRVKSPSGQTHYLNLTFYQKVILGAIAGWSLEMLDQHRDPWFEAKQASQFLKEGLTFELPMEAELQRTLSTLIDPGDLLEYKMQKNTRGENTVFYRIRSTPDSLLEAVKTSQDRVSIRVDFFARWLQRQNSKINPSLDLVNDWELEIIREILLQGGFITGHTMLDIGSISQNRGLSRDEVKQILKDLGPRELFIITGGNYYRKSGAPEKMQMVVDKVLPIQLSIVKTGTPLSSAAAPPLDTVQVVETKSLGSSWRESGASVAEELLEGINELEAMLEMLTTDEIEFVTIYSNQHELIHQGRIPAVGLELPEHLYLLDKLSIGPAELRELIATRGQNLLSSIKSLEDRRSTEGQKKLLLKLKKGLWQWSGEDEISEEELGNRRYRGIYNIVLKRIHSDKDKKK